MNTDGGTMQEGSIDEGQAMTEDVNFEEPVRIGVYRAIDSERVYQDAVWGPTRSGGVHSPTEFFAFMKSYVDEGIELCSRYADEEGHKQVLNTIRKIGALAVACMEQNGAPVREFPDEGRTLFAARLRRGRTPLRRS